MRLYKTTWLTKSVGGVNSEVTVKVQHHVWSGSQAEAASQRKRARQAYQFIPNSVETEAIDVPTDKKRLIKFLNEEHVLVDA